MFQFSPQLVGRLIEYFERHYGVSLNPAQAQDYLLSLAKLFDLLCKPDEREK